MLSLKCMYGANYGIEIVNNSNKIIQVTVINPRCVTAVDIGSRAVYTVPNDSIQLTLSFYGRDREIKHICTNCPFNRGRIIYVKERLFEQDIGQDLGQSVELVASPSQLHAKSLRRRLKNKIQLDYM